MMENIRGLIFDIQGHSVHDGPGSRTLVFLSGCPLRCQWCSNPEGLEFQQKIRYREQRCVGCLRCIDACSRQAISLNNTKTGLVFNRNICDICDTFECTKACLKEAIRINERWMAVPELMEILRRDRKYWGGRCGGVTFTGGEPMFQKDFLLAVLQQCREKYIHTSIETSGYAEQQTFLKIMSYIEFAFIDIKNMDEQAHKEKTGVSNKPILRNIAALASSNWSGRLIIRTPVIEGFNDSEENIMALAAFLKNNRLEEINILPFHRLGDSKWTQLGKVYLYRDQRETPEEKMRYIQQLFLEQNIACYVGYETPF